MATELEVARRLTEWAAWRSDQKLPNATEASMAKLFASEAAARICDRAARVMASHGFAAESAVQRYLRDGRGAALLAARADRIADLALRRSFLESVPANARLLARGRAAGLVV